MRINEGNTAEALTEAVTTMLTNARAVYPSAKIVWIYGMMIQVDNETIAAAASALADYITNTVLAE